MRQAAVSLPEKIGYIHQEGLGGWTPLDGVRDLWPTITVAAATYLTSGFIPFVWQIREITTALMTLVTFQGQVMYKLITTQYEPPLNITAPPVKVYEPSFHSSVTELISGTWEEIDERVAQYEDEALRGLLSKKIGPYRTKTDSVEVLTSKDRIALRRAIHKTLDSYSPPVDLEEIRGLTKAFEANQCLVAWLDSKGYKVDPVKPDGHCFYSSVIKALDLTDVTVQDLRNIAADWLGDDPEATAVRDTNTWADDRYFLPILDHLKVKISVIRPLIATDIDTANPPYREEHLPTDGVFERHILLIFSNNNHFDPVEIPDGEIDQLFVAEESEDGTTQP